MMVNLQFMSGLVSKTVINQINLMIGDLTALGKEIIGTPFEWFLQ